MFWQEAEASSISVMHCRIVALEQENVMLRVGRKADAESCQELEAQVPFADLIVESTVLLHETEHTQARCALPRGQLGFRPSVL